jgi:hypothetical protein
VGRARVVVGKARPLETETAWHRGTHVVRWPGIVDALEESSASA